VLSRLSNRVMRRPGVIALALILVFAAAGTVYAASRGASWRLGFVETLNSYSTGIVGSRGGGELFKIKNTSGGSGARAIRAEGNSSKATMLVKNTGGGSAAEFVTDSGKAPFKVNRTTKVSNLNADLLDGHSSSSFRRSVLPLGASQSGVWGEQAAADENGLAVIQFPSALPAALDASHVHYVTTATADCPGTGQAAAGHLCVYETFTGSMTFGASGFWQTTSVTSGAGIWGTVFYMTASSQTANAWGTWTVTAPTSLAGTGGGSGTAVHSGGADTP
jgi:hypothetical protein